MQNSTAGAFVYQIVVREMKPMGDTRYYAKVWAGGKPHPDFQEYWGRTQDEAERRAEEAVAEWQKQQKPLEGMSA